MFTFCYLSRNFGKYLACQLACFSYARQYTTRCSSTTIYSVYYITSILYYIIIYVKYTETVARGIGSRYGWIGLNDEAVEEK